MMTKKKRKMVLIGIPVVIILVLAIMVIILYLNTDMFKSSQTLFFKYFGKNFDSFYKVTESIENEAKSSCYVSSSGMRQHRPNFREPGESRMDAPSVGYGNDP